MNVIISGQIIDFVPLTNWLPLLPWSINDNFVLPPKVQIMLEVLFFGTLMKIMLEMRNYAKNYTSTIYKDLLTLYLFFLENILSDFKGSLRFLYLGWVGENFVENERVVFSWLLCFALQYWHVYTDRFADMGIIVIRPPGWGANFSQSCRLCSFSGHKQRCWTVLSELRYKVAYHPNTFFLNWKQRNAGKAVEDTLQCIKKYVAGVWTKTAKGYIKNAEEQVIRHQSKVWIYLSRKFELVAPSTR